MASGQNSQRRDELQQLYSQLENLLKEQKWEEADRKTLNIMLKVADREEEGALQIEDFGIFPCDDLNQIDQLWVGYSKGYFGFSVQKRIWQSPDVNSDLGKFISRVGWGEVKQEPDQVLFVFKTIESLTFDFSAPPGQLPVAVTYYGGNLETRLKYMSRLVYCSLAEAEPNPPVAPIPSPIKPLELHILHLSDLHFGTTEDANTWYSILAADLKSELNCDHLDALILSGDIANKSTGEEYSAAATFVTYFMSDFRVKRGQIIIVPGNHDLNWQLSERAIHYKDGKIDLNQEIHQRRFDNFRNFYTQIKREPYPLEHEYQGILYHLQKQKLLILGLNSAWKLDHIEKTDASINSNAITNALNKISDNEEDYKDCLKIAVWHHPLGEEGIKDRGFMERLAQAGFRFALHGHIHKAETSLYKYDMSVGGRKLDMICAGTFGAPTKELVNPYPWQYNLLELEEKKLTVYTRRREELNGTWKADARWSQGPGQNPLPYYEIPLVAG